MLIAAEFHLVPKHFKAKETLWKLMTAKCNVVLSIFLPPVFTRLSVCIVLEPVLNRLRLLSIALPGIVLPVNSYTRCSTSTSVFQSSDVPYVVLAEPK